MTSPLLTVNNGDTRVERRHRVLRLAMRLHAAIGEVGAAVAARSASDVPARQLLPLPHVGLGLPPLRSLREGAWPGRVPTRVSRGTPWTRCGGGPTGAVVGGDLHQVRVVLSGDSLGDTVQ